MKPIYSLRNIRKSYNGNVVLDIDELDLQPHRIYSLVGPNGCGKSTLLQILALLLQPDEGELYFEEERVVWNKRDLKRIRQDVTLVHQAPYLFRRSVRNNLAYGLKARGIYGDEQHLRIHEALDQVGLPAFGRRNARELSGGEMQRVAIARALVLNPKVLILDEPTASMDQKSIEAFDALIPTLKEKEMTVILATHMPDQPGRLGSDVIVMEQSRIVRR